MPPAPPTDAELEAYSDEADRFIAELDEEYYLHFAGHKDELELEPIYDRHEELTRLDRARSIGAAVNGGSRIRELWKFACEGYLGNLTRAQAERVAGLEAKLEATVDGETVPFRMLRPTIANEPDRARRERLERARNELSEEHLNAVRLDAAHAVRAAVDELGEATYLDLYRKFGLPIDETADQARAFLAATEQLYERAADRFLRKRVGVGLAEAERWDTVRAFRAVEWDAAFPGDKMLPALEATLADFGVDLRAQENVHLDVEQRPKKTPRAFCAPIEVPGKVMLVIQPMGGPDDWEALFHEAGHTEHFAHTRPELPMEARRLGDYATSEGWAMLLEHLTATPEWLDRRLDVGRPREYAAEAMTKLLWSVRRYCAKILYEVEFHGGGDPATLADRYVELLSDALRVEPSATDYLADIDEGFYVQAYLRSWAFEAQLQTFLRQKFGNAWFTRRDAGSLLRELWSEGQRYSADELLREVTGAQLELDAIRERVAEPIAAA